jgi:hypothetical protein
MRLGAIFALKTVDAVTLQGATTRKELKRTEPTIAPDTANLKNETEKYGR